MAEISPIAARKLARLKRDFLSMAPDEQLAFIMALRDRRAKPRVLKHVNSRRRAKDVEGIKEAQGPQGQESEAPF